MQRLSAHCQDAVRIDFEVDFHFLGAGLSRRDVMHRELAQRVVLRGNLALALQHIDRDRRLIVLVRLIFLRYIVRYLCVSLNDVVHFVACYFDS